MPSLAEIRQSAAAAAKQIEAVRFLTVQHLAARWGIGEDAVRAIPRSRLPYLEFGASKMRRFDPRDVEQYETTQKRGTAA